MIRDFLYIRKSDRKIILALLGVIVIALGVIFFAGGSNETNKLLPADTLSQKKEFRDSSRKKSYNNTRTVYVRTKVVYRDTSYRRGKALVDIDSDSTATHYQEKLKSGEHIDLNASDTTMLKTVPGIGAYFARKVVQYRERLGGYVSVDQLDEIEGFPLESKKFFVIEALSPHKLDLNHLSLNELKKHPYINFYMAREITNYRRLHGPLKSLSDLRLSKEFPPEVIARLQPYVEFGSENK
ncbi:MAG: helix-hairpin-helix domain-containing protein [Prevotella sp.]|nr:helix-hairpin-helix domain-containing protein [Prevotella sp.]